MITATRMDEWDPLSTRSTPRGIQKNELSNDWVIAPTQQSYIATNHWRLELLERGKTPAMIDLCTPMPTKSKHKPHKL